MFKFPVMSKDPKNAKELRFNNNIIEKRCTECIFSVAYALIYQLRGVKRGDDVKLRYIIVSDCHNGNVDCFSVYIGISRSGYATEGSSFCVNSDTVNMRKVFEDLFGQYAETEDIFNSKAKIEGVCLNLTGIGKVFLRDFAEYIHTVEEMMDDEIINLYGWLNPLVIPKDSFKKMTEEFDELIQRYC